MSNRNRSMVPHAGGGGHSHGLMPYGGGNMRSAFDDMDRMAERMMAGFGMPKMDISR